MNARTRGELTPIPHRPIRRSAGCGLLRRSGARIGTGRDRRVPDPVASGDVVAVGHVPQLGRRAGSASDRRRRRRTPGHAWERPPVRLGRDTKIRRSDCDRRHIGPARGSSRASFSGRRAETLACASLRQRRCSGSRRSGVRTRRHGAYAPGSTGPANWRFRWSSPSDNLRGAFRDAHIRWKSGSGVL